MTTTIAYEQLADLAGTDLGHTDYRTGGVGFCLVRWDGAAIRPEPVRWRVSNSCVGCWPRPGTFGELDSTGARSVLRRYSDAWFAAAARRKAGARGVARRCWSGWTGRCRTPPPPFGR